MTLPASGQKWLDTLETMRATIAELAAERDRYRDALVARHGGEPLALLSELDAARAERDAAISQASSLTGRLDGALEVQRKLRAERDDWKASSKLMEHKVITCGVAATNPDAELTRRGAYGEKWNSPQAEAVRVLRAERDAVRQELNELDRMHRLAATCSSSDDRDALLRIINDAFLSLHIPGSTKAFDGRNLVVHAQDSAEVAMVLRTERDEARRERDTALANTSLPGYVRLVEERDAAVADLSSIDAALIDAGIAPIGNIGVRVRDLTALRDAAVAQIAAVTAYRDGMIAAFSKLYGPEVQVDEHASTLARLIGDSHTLADIALELMDTEHGAEGSLAEAVRVLMSSLAAVTAQRD